MLEPSNMLDVVKQFFSIYFVSAAYVISKAPYMKATYIKALNNQMLSNLSEIRFLLDKV